MEIVVMPDPAAKAIAYVSSFWYVYYPQERVYVATVLPSEFTTELRGNRDDDQLTAAITVTDLGGTGVEDLVVNQVRLAFDVVAEGSVEASRIARLTRAALQTWPSYEPSVITVSGSHPMYNPDHRAGGRAAYTMYLDVRFRGTTQVLHSSQ